MGISLLKEERIGKSLLKASFIAIVFAGGFLKQLYTFSSVAERAIESAKMLDRENYEVKLKQKLTRN